MKINDPVNFDPSKMMPKDDARKAINAPLAREHGPHISGTNKMENYETPKPSLGKLGAKGQATKS